ncbi:hypothetical protein ACA910_015123 [Epithemia clementina (nom. ined.)]
MLPLAFRVVLCLVVFTASQGLRHGLSTLSKAQLFDHTALVTTATEEDRHLAIRQPRRIVVEGSVPASRFSPTDYDKLLLEQAQIIEAVKSRFESSVVEVLHTERNIANAIFFSLPTTKDDDAIDKSIAATPGVVSVSASVDLEEDDSAFVRTYRGAPRGGIRDTQELDPVQDVRDIAETYLGAGSVREKYCLTGQGVRVMVIDSGIDYTHSVFGGEGTQVAYQTAAATNQPRASGLFPTARVVDGRNFVFNSGNSSSQDTNPLDQPSGHGTEVATAIVAMAPDVELIAARVCDDDGICPDYAVIAAIAYAYEIGADVINISLGQRYADGYYHMLARTIDEAAATLGMTIVLPSGNYGNKPFIMGGIANVANGITVGATSTIPFGFMAPFSARGPGTLNTLKPDISAPGGTMILADSGTGGEGATAEGTSFSCPIVAGAAAVIKSKCPECSPFAIKAILMNNARRTIKYSNGNSVGAPVSWVGSGEVDIGKAVEASFWAYSMDDGQPSISLGLVDVTSDMVIRRTLRVANLMASCQGISAQAVFRNPQAGTSGAMEIRTTSSDQVTTQSCPNTSTVAIEFQIEASKVPANHMTSGGSLSRDPETLDQNEFDGWIVLTSTYGQEVSIPFHGILRRAADIVLGVNRFPFNDIFPADFGIGLQNIGAGTAQLDLYELLVVSEDDAEPDIDNESNLSPPADFQYIGYRTLPDDTCGFILEFAFQLWERRQTLFNTEIRVSIDVNRDLQEDYVLANRGPRTNDLGTSDCRIQSVPSVTDDWECTGFVADHATNSGTVVVRACSNDLGITPSSTVGVSFSSATYPKISNQADKSEYLEVSVPCTISSAPTSFNIQPGGVLPKILSGTHNFYNSYALGLLIVSNGYRNAESTGAAAASSEALAIPFPRVQLPAERTGDNLSFVKTSLVEGPGTGWYATTSACQGTRHLSRLEVRHQDTGRQRKHSEDINNGRHLEEVCAENLVPRVFLATAQPIATPTPRLSPAPTAQPLQMSSRPPAQGPTIQQEAAPTTSPSNDDINGAAAVSRINSSPSNAEDGVSATSNGQLFFHIGVLWQTTVVALLFLIA